MAKTLVIKGANYTDNAFDVVSFEGNKPCTGISLDKSTLSLTAIGETQTIVATLTPADTTDTLTWASYDTDVATVVNGVVTAVGLGTTSIIVTCGEQTATCDIDVSVEYSAEWDIGYHIYVGNGNNHASVGDLTSAMYSYKATGTKPLQYKGSDATKYIYPIEIPHGCKKVSIAAQNCYIGYVLTNLNTEGDVSGFLGIISSQGASLSGPTDSLVIDVPTGADGINVIIRKKNGDASQSLINDVTILFLSDQENE